jgi:hydroxymethylbilane synthase
MKIIIGSRGSDLALWQAHFVENQLKELGHEVAINIIETKGDKIQDLSFDKLEGKGFFTKEIEEGLLNKEIDLAVHSHKDLETSSPEGLIIAAVSYRENPTDTILIRKEAFDEQAKLSLKENPVVGTSSARRQTQLRNLRSDIQIKDLRGNVPTRINKLRDGQYDAIVLATAGLNRLALDLGDLCRLELSATTFIPAPAQGVLGLQIRSNDTALMNVLSQVNHSDVAEQIEVERSVLKEMEGGCQLPLGVYCLKSDDEWTVYTSFAANKNLKASINSYHSKNRMELVDIIVEDLKNGFS